MVFCDNGDKDGCITVAGDWLMMVDESESEEVVVSMGGWWWE